ncbi:MAG: STAS domain-containing protein [Betaproteobacteria bacterium]|nr:MAG: STAS domain-containing protein [Betaproteobacteria bacterium]
MALFYKPPAKKPEPLASSPRPAATPRSASARELAVHAAARKGVASRPLAEPPGGASAAGASIIDWSPGYASIEVLQTNPGLCAVLENAALLFASGQVDPARALLEDSVVNDHDTKLSPLAWLALFDLLQRANDRPAFDQLAMQYIVQFERSAPAWDERAPPAAAVEAKKGGFVAITGKLSGASATQLLGLRRAIEARVPRARLDLSSVISFDDSGARLLAGLLAQARQSHVELTVERPENLRLALDASIRKGREAGQGAWLLSLELLQWQRDQATFDDRAVDYAVAFEVSPPSWDPPRGGEQTIATNGGVEASVPMGGEPETLVCTGVMAGANAPQVNALAEFSHRRNVIVVDMIGVERVDFVCAGALLNTIGRIEAQRKTVQIVGASPIVRALLLLIGISPRHFVKKAA